jgi:hypothetical protein
MKPTVLSILLAEICFTRMCDPGTSNVAGWHFGANPHPE